MKLVLTSATLDADKFSAYFGGCPVLHIPGRQYNVDVAFSEESHEKDYAAAAVDAALDLHLHQPPGDILIFLTGQAEIDKVGLHTIAACTSTHGPPDKERQHAAIATSSERDIMLSSGQSVTPCY